MAQAASLAPTAVETRGRAEAARWESGCLAGEQGAVLEGLGPVCVGGGRDARCSTQGGRGTVPGGVHGRALRAGGLEAGSGRGCDACHAQAVLPMPAADAAAVSTTPAIFLTFPPTLDPHPSGQVAPRQAGGAGRRQGHQLPPRPPRGTHGCQELQRHAHRPRGGQAGRRGLCPHDHPDLHVRPARPRGHLCLVRGHGWSGAAG